MYYFIGSIFFLPGFLRTLGLTLGCPAQHIDATSKASTKKEDDEGLPPDTTSSMVGVLLISPSDRVLMFGCPVNMAKDVVYPPCFLKAVYELYPYVTQDFVFSFNKDV